MNTQFQRIGQRLRWSVFSWTLAALILPAARMLALEGPVAHLPGTYTMTWDGSQTDGLSEDGNMARSSNDYWWVVGSDGVHPQGATGKTTYVSSVAIADNTPVYWGPVGTLSVAISLIPGPYVTSEWMSFNAGESSLPNGRLRFSGMTRIEFWDGLQWTTNPVPTRWTMTVSHVVSGLAAPLVPAASLGLPADTGGLLRIANAGAGYRIHALFEAFDGQRWLPAYNYYNAPNTGGGTGGAQYTFNSGFFYELPPLEATGIQRIPPNITSITWSNLLSSVGYVVQTKTNLLQATWSPAYGFVAPSGVYTSLHSYAGDRQRLFRLLMTPEN